MVIDDTEWHPQMLQAEYAETLTLLMIYRTCFSMRERCWGNGYHLLRTQNLIPEERTECHRNKFVELCASTPPGMARCRRL
ncbi:hypothetical protein EDWATA_03189 [Edwardsiella tarda ATCC 23685]|uniref:Uncharacterized protein n=1 Tax=Edwardsiella tarda ATCC 23685 TaxID=500638 RepID=D4F8T7_EDWTA|nr:hypothetical protein EDWATA_03189 [Edwardsiella tarda ATCC 23685]